MQQMLEVRHKLDNYYSIIGWFPRQRYHQSHARFTICDPFGAGNTWHNLDNFLLDAPPLMMEDIILEMDVCYDATENRSNPYHWPFYKCTVPVDKLRKIRGFVENREAIPEDEWEREYWRRKQMAQLDQLIKLAHPPMLYNAAADQIKELDWSPGHVTFLRDRSEVELIREDARKAREQNKRPKKDSLLLLINKS